MGEVPSGTNGYVPRGARAGGHVAHGSRSLNCSGASSASRSFSTVRLAFRGPAVRVSHIPPAFQESCFIISLKPKDTGICLAAYQGSRNSLASEDNMGVLAESVSFDPSSFPD